MTRLVVPEDTDYTGADFDAIMDRLESAIPSVYPDWTDQSRANIGRIFLEGIGHVGDVLAEYQNSMSREAHLSTCEERVNAVRHANKLNYQPRGRTAATVTMQVTLATPAVLPVVVSTGLTIRSKKSLPSYIRVALMGDITIPAGQLSGTGTAEHAERQSHGFDASGKASQVEALPLGPVVSITSVVDAVGGWSQVDNFLNSSSTSRHYVRMTDENENVLLVFGDGINGRKPTGHVDVEYKTGGGSVSIDVGDLEVPEFTLSDTGGNPVAFTVTNTTAGQGGFDKESLAEIKRNAPASLAATERSITQDDFETNALRVAGVARALMLTSDQGAGVAENTGMLLIVAKGTQLASGRWTATAPTAATLAAVEALIDGSYPPTITFTYEALATPFYTVNVVARVRAAQGYSKTTMRDNIGAALADYFAALNEDLSPNEEIDFGYNYKDEYGDPDPYIPWSDIFNAVRDAEGVSKVVKSAFQPYDDVAVGLSQFPVLGTVTVVDDETGLTL